MPEPDVLQAALAQHKPPRPPPQQVSTVERWSAAVSEMQELGAKPKAIFDRLRLENADFTGSLSAIKRMCSRFESQSGDQPPQVTSAHHPVGELEAGQGAKRLEQRRDEAGRGPRSRFTTQSASVDHGPGG